MGFDKCEFCGLESKADAARSVINRHIRLAAEKSVAKRGNHPGKNTPEYQRMVEYRKLILPAASDEERQERISYSKCEVPGEANCSGFKEGRSSLQGLAVLSPFSSPFSSLINVSCCLMLIMFYQFIEATRCTDLVVSNVLGLCQ